MTHNIDTGALVFTTREEDRQTDRLAAQFGNDWSRRFQDLSPQQLRELEHYRTPIYRRRDQLGRPLQNLKVTHGLSAAARANLHAAVLRANAMGLVMNTSVTITWHHLGIYEEQRARDRMQLIMRAVRDAARKTSHQGRRLDTKICWIWAMENGPENGIHSHLLFACPADLRTRLRKIIRKAARDRIEKPKSAATFAVYMSDRPEPKYQSEALRQQWSAFGYLTKSPTVSYTPNGKARAAADSEIVGKRSGFSSHLLGGEVWKRYARDCGKDVNWARNYLRAGNTPFPLSLSELWREGVDRPSNVGATKSPPPPGDSYPKEELLSPKVLRTLRL